MLWHSTSVRYGLAYLAMEIRIWDAVDLRSVVEFHAIPGSEFACGSEEACITRPLACLLRPSRFEGGNSWFAATDASVLEDWRGLISRQCID